MSSNPTWLSYRTVVEESLAQQSIDLLSQQHERFADQWDGLCWLLARRPGEIDAKKASVNGKEFCLAFRSGNPDHGLKDIAVVYTYDDIHVVVHDVAVFESTSPLQS